ncbi:phospholipid/glycerol acyltransferase [Rhodomicrobium vannielii ATCC 17100]|uniref:Phospholipid/glycerol acyltransferase n=2 Tax=Rhodomicrobium TaxID=1068 RepID=E3I4D1_RHOVT|nr:phospholipid/glycerol acyltransferase [Rhodomicrobium vannielii ATCC 17100]
MKRSLNALGSEGGMDTLVFHGFMMRLLGSIRATVLLAAFIAVTLPLMLLQWLFLKLGLKQAKTLPNSYHKLVCRILGIRVHVEGKLASDRPVLLVSNHISWLDIPALSTVAPLSFVAKAEVGVWPFVSLLAKLQRTVFVDRTRRTLVKDKAGEIAERLATGDTIVLFAEGTSSDGNRILPFRSSLFSAASLAPNAANDNGPEPVVQTVSIAYTHLHGLPILRHERPFIAWYGDMDMMSHAWNVLKSGPIDVTVRIGEPVRLASLRDRKALAAFSEAEVRQSYVEQVTARPRAA